MRPSDASRSRTTGSSWSSSTTASRCISRTVGISTSRCRSTSRGTPLRGSSRGRPTTPCELGFLKTGSLSFYLLVTGINADRKPQATPGLWHGGSMTKVAGICLAVLLCIGFVNLGLAQSTDAINGEWLITRVLFGNTVYHKFTLKLENNKVTGAFASGRKIEGTLQGNVLHFIARDANSTIECTATLSGDTMSGKFVETSANDPKDVQEHTITGTRMPPPRSGPPRRHEFLPTTFHLQFSAAL